MLYALKNTATGRYMATKGASRAETDELHKAALYTSETSAKVSITHRKGIAARWSTSGFPTDFEIVPVKVVLA
jgi:hypothetical protein